MPVSLIAFTSTAASFNSRPPDRHVDHNKSGIGLPQFNLRITPSERRNRDHGEQNRSLTWFATECTASSMDIFWNDSTWRPMRRRHYFSATDLPPHPKLSARSPGAPQGHSRRASDESFRSSSPSPLVPPWATAPCWLRTCSSLPQQALRSLQPESSTSTPIPPPAGTRTCRGMPASSSHSLMTLSVRESPCGCPPATHLRHCEQPISKLVMLLVKFPRIGRL
eukprot:766400-Hanusia_phi.AAC.9